MVDIYNVSHIKYATHPLNEQLYKRVHKIT